MSKEEEVLTSTITRWQYLMASAGCGKPSVARALELKKHLPKGSVCIVEYTRSTKTDTIDIKYTLPFKELKPKHKHASFKSGKLESGSLE